MLVAALLTVLGACSLLVARAEAATVMSGSSSPLPGSGFQGGDGDQADAAPYVDWQGLQGLGKVSHYDDPQADDTIFDPGGTAKEGNPGAWSFATANDGSNPKNENFFDAYSNLDTSGDTFLNLAFTREATSGTAYLGFELNQRAGTWNNGSADIPCRTTGDLLVTLQVNGNTTSMLLETWTSAVTDAATGCAKTGSLAPYTTFVDNLDAQAAVNETTITNYLPESGPLPAGAIGPLQFGEGSLNLSSLLEGALGTPCFSFGSIWMHSRSSTEDSSTLKDYIAPSPLLVRSCAASGVKFHDLDADGVRDAGEPGLAGFRMFADFNGDGVRQPDEAFADTDATGAYAIAVKPIKLTADPATYDTSYRIREQLAPPATGSGGWTCSAPAGATGADGVPSFANGTGGAFGCGYGQIDVATKPIVTGKDFGNYRKATIIVEKQTLPDGSPGSWAFSSSVAGDGAFSLADGGQKVMTVDPGSYTATETLAADFDLTGIACSGDTVAPGSSGDTATRTATFNAQSGETITCVFTNTRKTGELTVRKVLAPTTDPGRFDLKIGDEVVVDDGGNGAQGTRTLATGLDYTISEADGAGTSLAKYDSAVVCKDGATTVASGSGTSLSGVPVVEGHDVICTFTNTKRAHVRIAKTEAGAPPVGVWTFTLASGGGDPVTRTTDAQGGIDFGYVVPGAYTLCEVKIPTAWHTSLEEPPYGGAREADGDGTVKVCVGLDLAAGDAEPIAVDNTAPSALVVKEGPQLAHHGEQVSYTFDVSNTGNIALKDVEVSDDRCANVSDAPTKLNADDDDLLENPGQNGTSSEVWRFTCSYTLPGHAGDEENPIVNTVTATADDVHGNPVSATDQHATRILHPDIAVDKQVRRAGQTEYVGQGDDTDGGLVAHVGDTLEYRFDVTGGDSDTPITVTDFSDPRCDAAPQGPVRIGGDVDGLLEPGETWTYTCSHVITADDPSPLPNTATVTGHDEIGGEVEDSDTTTVKVIHPSTLVVKEGNLFAYPGDTVTFTFAVTNDGDTPLHDVAVTDDRCAPVTGPTERRDGNQDDLLDPGETWMFTCAKQIPADHRIGDENPIRNVATATGKDALDKPVESTDDHLVQVLHPAVDIEKTGPESALAGTALGYTLTVTNPGDVPFAAQDVVVTDPKCEAPPAGPGTGADATPASLDPGDTWIYTCTAQTTGQPVGTFVNTATVTAKDVNGHPATDTDDFPTILEGQGVLQEEIVSGTARLSGPSGCVKRAFKATVRGRRITQVTFLRDGKRIKRIAAKPGQRAFSATVRPAAARGVHRVTVKIRFAAASETRTRTLRLSYQRCRRQVIRPQFTG